jgi:hypothetical protein
MGLDLYFYKNNKGKEQEMIGQFRKVNFLVNFFEGYGDVENLVPLPIEESWVRDLIACCDEVLKDHCKADEILPTCSGFFFGSTDYDEYYWKDLKYTLEEVTKILDEDIVDWNNEVVEYCDSW